WTRLPTNGSPAAAQELAAARGGRRPRASRGLAAGGRQLCAEDRCTACSPVLSAPLPVAGGAGSASSAGGTGGAGGAGSAGCAGGGGSRSAQRAEDSLHRGQHGSVPQPCLGLGDVRGEEAVRA